MIDLLLQPLTALLIALVLLVCLFLLISRWHHLSHTARGILLLLTLLSLAYFLFLLWLTLGFGRGAPHQPTPISGT